MPEENQIIIPTNGVKDREIQLGDFVSGQETGIKYEDRIKNKKWIDFALPDTDGDYQWAYKGSGNPIFDGSTCTNYSCKHSIENQMNWLLAKGLFSADEIRKLEFFKFIVNGKVQRLSARYNAIKSGTNGGQWPDQFTGNYVYKPWDSARHDGMVPETLCPFDRTRKDWTAKEYFDPACITAEAEAAAKAFKEVMEIKYEVVFTTLADMQKHSKQAPLSISAGVCRPWGARVAKCDLNSGHATVLLELPPVPADYDDQDSYWPAFKKLESGYRISYAVKGLVTPRSQLKTEILAPQTPYSWIVKMNKGERSEEIRKLQDFLKQLGFFRKDVESTGYYGMVTCAAVLKFQLQYKLDTFANLNAWKGEHVASRTLKQLNLLSK